MKKFVISLLAILIGLLVVDRTVGVIMDNLRDHTMARKAFKIRKIMNKMDCDNVILGTSRAEDHFIPSILEDSIGETFYNAAMTGTENIFSQYAHLCLLLENNCPKRVILELSDKDCKDNGTRFALSHLYPYAGINEGVDSVLRNARNYPLVKLLKLYRYKGSSISYISGLFKDESGEAEAGYKKISPPVYFPDALIWVDITDKNDELKLHYIEKFIQKCREHDIQLIFTCSPRYRKPNPKLLDPVREIAEKHEIPFFDYERSEEFLKHPEYFRDRNHLWDAGARKFTSTFAHDLKQYIKCDSVR